jgi:hypothetical protein
MRHTQFSSSILETPTPSSGLKSAHRIQRRKKSAQRHHVSFPDLTPKNNSFDTPRTNIQIRSGD